MDLDHDPLPLRVCLQPQGDVHALDLGHQVLQEVLLEADVEPAVPDLFRLLIFSQSNYLDWPT